MTKNDLLKTIIKFFLESREFNGISASTFEISKREIRGLIAELVKEGKVSICFGDIFPNPHVKAFNAEPIKTQIHKINTLGLQDACLYPEKEALIKIVDQTKFQDKPFTLKLALGEPQLSYYSFDLSVLEGYRNDPRYHFDLDDISGSLSVKSEHYESGTMVESDQIFLQTFGFSYDSNMNRAVAVYLWYLATLSPEHQRIWHTKLLSDDYKLHPDYHRQTMGSFPKGVSIFTAFLGEMHHINEMSKLMDRAILFKKEFTGDKRPRAFSFLLRPTLKEFNDFVHLLDKMISDNINLDFFKGDISLEEEIERSDGRLIVKPKGSLRILDDWLTQTVRFPDPTRKNQMITIFKKVRKKRQHPAHAIEEDVFDQKYFMEQRVLMKDAYDAIRDLRLIFKNHPQAKNYDVPAWLQKGKIWTY